MGERVKSGRLDVPHASHQKKSVTSFPSSSLPGVASVWPPSLRWSMRSSVQLSRVLEMAFKWLDDSSVWGRFLLTEGSPRYYSGTVERSGGRGGVRALLGSHFLTAKSDWWGRRKEIKFGFFSFFWVQVTDSSYFCCSAAHDKFRNRTRCPRYISAGI